MEPRAMVAREAARLLYEGIAEEYKDAKEKAARNLGINAMPSNHEVASELDTLADRVEGDERRRLLVRMRGAALEVMRLLGDLEPRLIGSVWRGTARRGSDIDIVVYSSDPEEVEARLSGAFDVEGSGEVTFLEEGQPRRATHVKLRLGEDEAEVVVRPPEERREERCEIYGDLKRGLGLGELERLMKADPLRRFVPGRRYR